MFVRDKSWFYSSMRILHTKQNYYNQYKANKIDHLFLRPFFEKKNECRVTHGGQMFLVIF